MSTTERETENSYSKILFYKDCSFVVECSSFKLVLAKLLLGGERERGFVYSSMHTVCIRGLREVGGRKKGINLDNIVKVMVEGKAAVENTPDIVTVCGVCGVTASLFLSLCPWNASGTKELSSSPRL